MKMGHNGEAYEEMRSRAEDAQMRSQSGREAIAICCSHRDIHF